MRKQLNIVIYLKTERVLNYEDLEIWNLNKLKIVMLLILRWFKIITLKIY
jgi:hypothetical protein